MRLFREGDKFVIEAETDKEEDELVGVATAQARVDLSRSGAPQASHSPSAGQNPDMAA